MTTLVTPARLKAVYGLLCQMPPFCRWELPKPERIRFSVTSSPDRHANMDWDESGSVLIQVNVLTNLTLNQMAASVAHEMVHLRQHQKGRLADQHEKQHNIEFHRLARLVCRDLGFNAQEF